MSALIVAALALAALTGLLIVLTRDPKRQIFALAANGLALGALFFVLQAPDVALSEIAVNTAVTPLLFVAAMAAVAINEMRR
ncbi:MAG TPA: DUF4040 domain-containing protein [Xanthobacteraceae bacterium]|jgi:uncharacterized MnhB-related membrane protein|nr:DUF4040 domain-containing protein [Xanthobacteraceae bacterium]